MGSWEGGHRSLFAPSESSRRCAYHPGQAFPPVPQTLRKLTDTARLSELFLANLILSPAGICYSLLMWQAVCLASGTQTQSVIKTI